MLQIIMTIAVFPGSFDPPTYGHLNIIERASKLFDKVDVVVAVNSNKKYLFDSEERVEMMKALTEPWQNVSVHSWNRLIVEYAEKNNSKTVNTINITDNAKVLLRGIRNTNDFAYEFDLSLMNHNLNSNIETLFIPTEPRYVIVKSSSIKELAMFGGDISSMVPPIVCEEMKKKYKNIISK